MSTASTIELRDLHTIEECRQVVAVEDAVWGRNGEAVPATVLLVSAKRGGVLIGAFAGEALIGFVWSMPGVRDDGIRTQWSHMLGVLPDFRGQRVAERLKAAQRERVIAQRGTLIEWTFDPLQAANAHFNLRVLGAVGASYGVNIYGALMGPLHRGTPTDRLIVEWWIQAPHVVRRLAARTAAPTPEEARSAELLDALVAIQSSEDGRWVRPEAVRALDGRRILVPVPPNFLDMQQQATDVALAWRLAMREVMTAALSRGYRAVDFFLNRERGGGSYLLAKDALQHS